MNCLKKSSNSGSFRINHSKHFLLSPYLGISQKPSFLGIADKEKRMYLCSRKMDALGSMDATGMNKCN